LTDRFVAVLAEKRLPYHTLHASDVSIGAGAIKPFKAKLVDNTYQRKELECEQ